MKSYPLAACWLVVLALLGAERGLAQVPVTNPPPPRLVRPPYAVTTPPVARPAVTNQDPLNTLMTSVASIDIDSPVTVQAEFDPPVVALGGRAVYRLVLTAMNESVTLPDKLPVPGGLEMVAGGRGQIFQPSAARLQPRTTINYRVTARTNGTFVMPSFTLTAYGKPVTVPEARLTVVPPGPAAMREAPRMLMELPDTEYYVGQTIKIRVFLPDPGDGTLLGLSQVRITGESLINEPMIFSQRRDTIQRNGRAFPVFIQEVVATPISSGRQTLVAQGHAVISRMMPGQIGVLQSAQVLVDSDPVTIDVKSLPKEGQLPGFTGAIGIFHMDPPKISTNEIRAGELVSLSVTFKGEGNVGRLVPPQAPFLRQWQVFPPMGDPTPAYAIQLRGSNTFSFTLIPLSDRVRATPAIPFCYFDPRRKTYVDLTVPPVPIRVKPAQGGLTAVRGANPMPNPESAEPADRESELVMTGLAETPGRRASTLVASQRRPWFLFLQLLPAAALAGFWGWDWRRRYLESHPEYLLKRRARRQLRRELRLTRRAAVARDPVGYVTGAVKSLRVACAPHAAGNPDALVCADVLRELPAPDRQGRPGQVVRRLFTAADAIRFAGARSDGADLLETRPDLERALRQLRGRL